MHFLHLSTCVFLFTVCLLAQSNVRRGTVRGEIQGSLPSDAQVEMKPCAGGAPVELSSFVGPAGGFELRDVEPGCYKVSVVASTSGTRLYESIHDVNGQGGLQIRLKETKADRPAGTGVALGALRPKPSKKAAKLLEEASRLSSRGDYEGAAVKLRAAIEKDPAFAEAHMNLGAQLARLRQPAAALAEFETARLLGLNNATLLTNMAAALVELRRFEEAETAISAALRADDNYRQAHFMMGQLLIRTQQRPALAAEHFRRAAPIPGARIMLAQVLAHLGQRKDAVAEVTAYLESGHTAYRGVAEKLLNAWR